MGTSRVCHESASARIPATLPFEESLGDGGAGARCGGTFRIDVSRIIAGAVRRALCARMQPTTPASAARAYEPRRAESTVLYSVVAAELERFLAAAGERGHALPAFIETTFREFLTCGVAAHGFVRLHCFACGHDRVLPFSCKRRGICSSCDGRRMAETAANLVDGVIP